MSKIEKASDIDIAENNLSIANSHLNNAISALSMQMNQERIDYYKAVIELAKTRVEYWSQEIERITKTDIL